MHCVATPQHCAPPVPAMSSAVAPPSARCGTPHLSAQQLEFLGNWQHSVQPRLEQLLTLLGQKDISRSLALAQVWTYLPVLLEGRQHLKAEQLCLLGSPQLGVFHQACHAQGVPVALLGPMAKAWESGVVKVVQSLEDLSRETHPCNRLQGSLERLVEEVVYLPVFDCGPCAGAGVVAVVELLLSSAAHDYNAVPNAITAVARLLEGLQLSVSNPAAQRHLKPSPPSSPPKQLAHQQQQQQQESANRTVEVAEVPCCGSDAAMHAPTAPSSPVAPVATPVGSPGAASPFASATSPLDSPKRADPGPSAPCSVQELVARVRDMPPRAPPAGGRGSAPPSFAGLQQLGVVRSTSAGVPAGGGGAAAGSMSAAERLRRLSVPPAPVAWPGAGWVPAPASAPAQPAAGADEPRRSGSNSSMRRSLSRTASFRKGLAEMSSGEDWSC